MHNLVLGIGNRLRIWDFEIWMMTYVVLYDCDSQYVSQCLVNNRFPFEWVMLYLLLLPTTLGSKGMEEVSVVNGVPIWRPLLPYTKEAIFNFAHTYGIPYHCLDTNNTTNRTRVRGIIRNDWVSTYVPVYYDSIIY